MKRLVILLSLLMINYSKENIIYCDIKGHVNKPGVYEIKESSTIQDVINLAGGLKKGAYTDNINLSKKVKDEMVIYIYDKEHINKLKSLNNCVCENTYKYIECSKEEMITTKITTTTKPILTTEKKENYTTKQITTSIKKTENVIPKTTTVKTSTTKITSTNITVPTTTICTITESKELININTATIDILSTLKGLGEKKASAVIEYRNINGPFNSIDDIKNVSGIGNATFEKIKDYIKV